MPLRSSIRGALHESKIAAELIGMPDTFCGGPAGTVGKMG